MNIIVREATKADAESIADLSRETFYNTYADMNSKEDMDKFLNEQFTREALIAEVGAEGNYFLVAMAGNELVGYVRLRENAVPPLTNAIEIARIYAATNLIGKGVGTALMNASIEISKALGKSTLWLGVWEKNERAINFYRKFGFEKFDVHDFILGNDVQTDWLLKLPLT